MTIEEILAPIVQDNLRRSEEAKVKLLRDALEKCLASTGRICGSFGVSVEYFRDNPDSRIAIAEARRVLKETES